jgi:hypothetical protein
VLNAVKDPNLNEVQGFADLEHAAANDVVERQQSKLRRIKKMAWRESRSLNVITPAPQRTLQQAFHATISSTQADD